MCWHTNKYIQEIRMMYPWSQLDWELLWLHSWIWNYDVGLFTNCLKPRWYSMQKWRKVQIFPSHLRGICKSVMLFKNSKRREKKNVKNVRSTLETFGCHVLHFDHFYETLVPRTRTDSETKEKKRPPSFIQFQNVKLFCVRFLPLSSFFIFSCHKCCIVCFIFIKTFRLSQTTR